MRIAAGLLAVGCMIAVAACGETVSTGSFKGESRNVAQTISDFQKDATAGDQTKLCANDLAATVVARLKGAAGCETALKGQLREVDTPSLTVESIALSGATAQARVKSTWSGKNRVSTLSLVKEGARWKVSGAQG